MVTTDEQVRRLMKLTRDGLPLSTAAAKAGMDEKTARKGCGSNAGQMVGNQVYQAAEVLTVVRRNDAENDH